VFSVLPLLYSCPLLAFMLAWELGLGASIL
jgi:hypothetical protein